MAAKIPIDGVSRAVGSIKDGGDFGDVGSAKCGEAFCESLQHFDGRCLIYIFVVREEVRDNSVRDRVDDVEDTSKIGARVEREVGGGPVVLDLSDVDFGYVIGFRRLIKASWLYFLAIEDVFSHFHLGC